MRPGLTRPEGAAQRGVRGPEGAWRLERRMPARWSFSNLLGSGQTTWGLGVLGRHRNPQQIQICGRRGYLCIDMPLFVAQFFLTSSCLSWSFQTEGESRGAGGGRSCQGAVYLRFEKCTKGPLAPTHHYYHTAAPRGAAWRKLRWLLGTVGSQSCQPHDESQITLLGN